MSNSGKKLATNDRKWATPGRRGKMNSSKWRKVMEDLEVTGNLEASAAHNGISKSSVYKYMEKYPELKEDYEIAREKAVRTLEMEAYRRAVEGTDTPVFYNGVQVGSYKVYSDRLLEKLLSASSPTRWSAKQQVSIEHTHEIGDNAKAKLASLLQLDNQSDQSEDDVIDAEWEESNQED